MTTTPVEDVDGVVEETEDCSTQQASSPAPAPAPPPIEKDESTNEEDNNSQSPLPRPSEDFVEIQETSDFVAENETKTTKDDDEGGMKPNDSQVEDTEIIHDVPVVEATPNESHNDEEENEIQSDSVTPISNESERLGKEVFFSQGSMEQKNYSDWDNLRWMSYSGCRQIAYVGSVYRFIQGRRTLFWSGDQYLERIFVVYTEPHLILILRPLRDVNETHEILNLPPGSTTTKDNEEDVNDVMKSYLIVESVIDPNTCKLKLSPLTTVTVSVPTDISIDDYRRRSCFELVTPTENIILSAVSLRKGAERALSSFNDAGAFLETTRIEHILQETICDAHRPEQGITDLSWKHQIILGTLHSYVVLGNQTALQAALANATSTSSSDPQSEYVDPRIIDAKDECGRTPLHYACSSRFTSAVSALVKAGANVDLRIEPDNMTACHLAALNLDSQSLKVILSVNRRPGVIDSWGRTPMYLAIMDGHSIGGTKDLEAWDRCISVLEEYGASIDPPMGLPHPVCSLARTWSHGELETLMRHVASTYPIATPDMNDRRRVGISISALFQYPIHSSLIALRRALADDQSPTVIASTEREVSRTLEILFSCGFEPNERVEGIIEIFDGMDDLVAHIGFAPTQILAAAALDAMKQRGTLGDARYLTIMKIISGVMCTLVSHGGRLSLDPPQSKRPKEGESSCISRDSLARNHDGENHFMSHDPSLLKLHDNKKLIELLGAVRLKSAENSWNDLRSITTVDGVFSFHTDKLAIQNSEAPGGSDVKSCSICWVVFGTITNRKHRCRISRRHVCNDCSTKSISDGKEDHRVSDGQFLLGRYHVIKSSKPRKVVIPQKQPSAKTTKAIHSSGLARLEAQESTNRVSLFGSVMSTMTKAVFGEDEEQQQQQNGTTNHSHAAESIGGLNQSLNQTRNLLNERGDKLNTLADKSDRLVNASKDFANMAKELNRQTQGGFFW